MCVYAWCGEKYRSFCVVFCTGCGESRDIYVECVHMMWGKVEIFIWECTQCVGKGRDIYVGEYTDVGKGRGIYVGEYTDVGKGKDIYVGCVHRVWGKVEIFMCGVCTGCG